MVSKGFLKTVLSMLCIFAIALGSICNVSAAASDVMFDLTSLGILDDLEVSDDLNSNITRAEFSQLVVNLLGYHDIAAEFDDLGVFADIAGNEYQGAINLLYDLNIISGTGTNTFSPENVLTFPQVGKFMVNILGYSNIVNSTDLYAYSMLAGSLGVFEDVDSSKATVSWEDALVIAHNALDIDIMTKDFGLFGDNYRVVEGKTLRTSLSTTNGKDIVRMKGIVTADSVTYLYQAYPNMKTNTVEIDGKLYKCNFDVPVGLVGMKVNFYVDYSEDTDGVIVSIGASEKNVVTQIYLDKIGKADADKIDYYVSDTATERVLADSTAKVIVNDRWIRDAVVSDVDNYSNGFVYLIDNDEDESADVIYVYSFTDAIVEKVYAETMQVYFANNQLIDNARYVSLNEEEDDTIVKLVNANGETITVNDILENNIISMAKSADGQVINVVVSDKIVTGVVNEIDEYSITIGSDVYDYITKPDVDPGTHIDAYINFMNKLFYAEKTANENTYAYVYKVQKASDISDTVKVALILPGYISETTKNTVDDEGSSEDTKTLFFRNDSKNIYELETKVALNGTKVSATDAMSSISGQIISYTLNADNRISQIETLDVFNNDNAKKTYNQNGKTFSSKAKEGFGITESETMSICVPTNSGATDDDLLVPVKLVHGSSYSINAYDVDEVSIAGLVVISAEMRSGIAGAISRSTSNIGVVKKISTVLDAETGDEFLKVNMITGEGEKSYTVSNLASSSVVNKFKSLSKGDMFFYETIEGSDELSNCELIQDFDNYNIVGTYNEGQDDEFCIGKVSYCRYTYVSALKNRWTDSVTIDCGSSNTTYEIYHRGTPVIFLIDDDGNTKLGTFDDIQCGNTIFVSVVESTVRALAVRK